MRKLVLSFLLGATSLIAGCLPAPKGETPIHYAEDPDVQPAGWEKRGEDARQWTLHTYHELRLSQPSPADIEPADLKDFCPEYPAMDRVARLNFWVQLVVAMARFESSFRPETFHAESFKDQHGRQVVSRGLLQMSLGSVEKHCAITRTDHLHDPFKNLTCGVKLLLRYVQRDNKITDKAGDTYLGGARYWAVLRAGHKDFLEKIQASTQEFCARYR